MSSVLYALGRWSYRRKGWVVAGWLLILAIVGGLTGLLSQGTQDTFEIPGTESQTALDQLDRTFPQVSGTTAQLVVVAAQGQDVTGPRYRHAVAGTVHDLKGIDGVRGATSPYDEHVHGLVADDKSAAIVQVQFRGQAPDVSDATQAAVLRAGPALDRDLPPGATVTVGGGLFAQNVPAASITEAAGLVIALLVLFVVLRSFLAAGMPLVSALLAVGLSMSLIFLATAFGPVGSTTPLLALMLGLAVGIDYTLFILFRHVQQVRDGMEPEESAAQATATSGSAVIFAGLTVFIALVGLAVARIPFLTTMGIAAALAVLIAIVVSITLTPAFLGLAGRRLGRPRRGGRPARSPRTQARQRRRAARTGLLRHWVRAATRFPVVTVVLVAGVLALVSVPALSLRLALPDAGMQPPDSGARRTYDLVSQHFGPGYNGPLIATATIVTSHDPVKLMDDLGDEIATLPGVEKVLLSTPNAKADTGIVQIVPSSSPDSPRTAVLVQEIRDRHAFFHDEYGVDLAVTGQTAVGIDISDRLARALLPFGLFVVGLSLILLAMVFRSIAVPIKATIGYLLSVGAAFGAVAAVFDLGYGADLLGVAKVGPVISFLPIILMGVLFGLAMDYEVFLVSRMREEYVHGGDARRAVEEGFVGSGRVVTAAALIMFSVFVSFIPEGDSNIKPIAVGLATGVFVDAFLVRMTLVPAVMTLLGRRAWWIPRGLDRVLPTFDVEGEAIRHELALRDWPGDGSVVAARGLTLDGRRGPVYRDVGLTLPADAALVVRGPDRRAVTALVLTLAGRLRPSHGDLKVAGRVVPEHAGAVRRRAGLALAGTAADPVAAVRDAVAGRPRLVVVDGCDLVADAGTRHAMAEVMGAARAAARAAGRPFAVVLGTADPAAAADLLAGDPGPHLTYAVETPAALAPRKETVPL